ncbi:MAG: hypothetical protein AAF226_00005, partial [Verrucomicrobiota bacterium]
MRFLILLMLLGALNASAIEVKKPSETEVERLSLDTEYYQKYLAIEGFPVIASAQVSDYALKEAVFVIRQMIGHRPDVLHALNTENVRLTIMGVNQFTTDVPEHSHLKPAAYWDKRARGLGSSKRAPAVSVGEENLLGYDGDPYREESIMVHEFAHSIHHGLRILDPKFQQRLEQTYNRAKLKGLWKKKYAGQNPAEYFAECVQSWFDTNREDDHDHNHVNTRKELIEYDNEAAKLMREIFGDNDWRYIRPDLRNGGDGHLEGYDVSAAPKFVWPEAIVKAFSDHQSGKGLAQIQPAVLDGFSLPSVESKHKIQLRVKNRTAQTLRLYWIDFKGECKPLGQVDPDRELVQQTFGTHRWVLT